MAESEQNSFYTQDDITVLDGLEPLKSRRSPLQIDTAHEKANSMESAPADSMKSSDSNEGKATR